MTSIEQHLQQLGIDDVITVTSLALAAGKLKCLCARGCCQLPTQRTHHSRSTILCPPQVHKFGGTCVSAADRITAVAEYIINNAEASHNVVVVSAMGSHPSSPVKVHAAAHPGCLMCCWWCSVPSSGTGAA